MTFEETSNGDLQIKSGDPLRKGMQMLLENTNVTTGDLPRRCLINKPSTKWKSSFLKWLNPFRANEWNSLAWFLQDRKGKQLLITWLLWRSDNHVRNLVIIYHQVTDLSHHLSAKYVSYIVFYLSNRDKHCLTVSNIHTLLVSLREAGFPRLSFFRFSICEFHTWRDWWTSQDGKTFRSDVQGTGNWDHQWLEGFEIDRFEVDYVINHQAPDDRYMLQFHVSIFSY